MQDLSGVSHEFDSYKLYCYRYNVLELKFIFNKNIQNSTTYTISTEIHPPIPSRILHILETEEDALETLTFNSGEIEQCRVGGQLVFT